MSDPGPGGSPSTAGDPTGNAPTRRGRWPRPIGWGPDDVLLSRHDFLAIRDLLFHIEAALQDVDQDLAAGADPEEYRKALWHLYEAAGGVRAVSFEPRAIGD